MLCFCLPLTCCMSWALLVVLLSAVYVFEVWPVSFISLCLQHRSVFSADVFCSDQFVFIRRDCSITVSSHPDPSSPLPVHLGRNFGASLSWPVTLVTRWTSAPSTSARGRCWWASWTRTVRDCDTTTTTRTRWDETLTVASPLTVKRNWGWPGNYSCVQMSLSTL